MCVCGGGPQPGAPDFVQSAGRRADAHVSRSWCWEDPSGSPEGADWEDVGPGCRDSVPLAHWLFQPKGKLLDISLTNRSRAV